MPAPDRARLTRDDVAIQRNGIVRVKTTGEEIGTIERVGIDWRVVDPTNGRTTMHPTREYAIREVLLSYNRSPGT